MPPDERFDLHPMTGWAELTAGGRWVVVGGAPVEPH